MPILSKGDSVAVVSMSWGGAGDFPERYEAGKRELESFGVEVVEMANALKPASWLKDNPQVRADDVHQAFSDPKIKMVISAIGGDDSLIILPFLNADLIALNTKPFLGYSDSTVFHLYLHNLGVPSFYGPSVMSGFAEQGGMFAYTKRAVEHVLFGDALGVVEKDHAAWSHARSDFKDDYSVPRERLAPIRRLGLQGAQASGHLLGGCVEVLSFMRGTPAWPAINKWQHAILFLEIADAQAFVAPEQLTWLLRSMFYSGELKQVNGILFGRVGQDVPVADYPMYEQAIIDVLNECGLSDIPVISRMEFGHTDPMTILPLGARVNVDAHTCEVEIVSLS